MTKIAGITDYIGPSGGIYSQGDYYITADSQAGNGDIHISGTNMFIRFDGPDSGDGRWEQYNRGDIDIISSGNIRLLSPLVKKIDLKTFGQFSASGQNMILTAKYHGGAPTVEGLYLYSDNWVSIGSSNYNDNTPYNVGVYSRNNLTIATENGEEIDFDSGNIDITTIPGFRPTINTSGIVVIGDSIIEFTPTPQKVIDDAQTGQLVARSASEDQGEGRLIYDSGSGMVPLSTGSGIFYGYFVEAGNSGVPGSAAPTGPGIIPWGAVTHWDAHFLHDKDDKAVNTYIWVTQAGLYEICYTVTVDQSSGSTRTGAQIRCRKNNISTIGGSTTYTYNRDTTNGKDTATWYGLVWLDAGDRISVDVQEYGIQNTSLEILRNGCSLYMKLIRPKNIY